MHHFAAHKAAAQLAAHPHARTHAQGFLVRGVKVQKPQGAGVAAVIKRDAQLAAWAKSNFAVGHLAFDLHHLAIARIGQQGDAGFVFITQRQMQRQVNVTAQAKLVQRFLCGCFNRRGSNFDNRWHGTIVPV